MLSRVLDFEEFVLTVADRHLKGVFSGYKLTFEAWNLLESFLPEIIEIEYHGLLLSLFFIFTQRSSCFVTLHFWKGK